MTTSLRALILALILPFSTFLAGPAAFAGSTKKNTAAAKPTYKTLEAASKKYRKAALVEMNVEKQFNSELTGKNSSYSGEISLSQGLFRMETTLPEKSLIVFDGKVLWNETQPSPDFPGPVQVTKSKIKSGEQQQVLFATLLSRDPIEKHFKILSEEKKDGVSVFEATPLTKNLNITSLTITVNSKDNAITELSFVDDISNVTVMKFSKIQFKATKSAKLFNYKAPQGAQVTEL